MSGAKLAKTLGVGRATLYRLRNMYRGAPLTFDDVEGWRKFVAKHAIAAGADIGSTRLPRV
jgi:uncharacterized protein (DUF924 family)